MGIKLNDEIRQKLEFVTANVDKIPESEFVENIVPLLNKIEYESYEWEADFIGITRDGKIGYVFDSGCSCNEPEWDEDDMPSSVTETTLKGFELELDHVSDWMGAFNYDDIYNRLDDLIAKINE